MVAGAPSPAPTFSPGRHAGDVRQVRREAAGWKVLRGLRVAARRRRRSSAPAAAPSSARARSSAPTAARPRWRRRLAGLTTVISCGGVGKGTAPPRPRGRGASRSLRDGHAPEGVNAACTRTKDCEQGLVVRRRRVLAPPDAGRPQDGGSDSSRGLRCSRWKRSRLDAPSTSAARSSSAPSAGSASRARRRSAPSTGRSSRARRTTRWATRSSARRSTAATRWSTCSARAGWATSTRCATSRSTGASP